MIGWLIDVLSWTVSKVLPSWFVYGLLWPQVNQLFTGPECLTFVIRYSVILYVMPCDLFLTAEITYCTKCIVQPIYSLNIFLIRDMCKIWCNVKYNSIASFKLNCHSVYNTHILYLYIHMNMLAFSKCKATYMSKFITLCIYVHNRKKKCWYRQSIICFITQWCFLPAHKI